MIFAFHFCISHFISFAFCFVAAYLKYYAGEARIKERSDAIAPKGAVGVAEIRTRHH